MPLQPNRVTRVRVLVEREGADDLKLVFHQPLDMLFDIEYCEPDWVMHSFISPLVLPHRHPESGTLTLKFGMPYELINRDVASECQGLGEIDLLDL